MKSGRNIIALLIAMLLTLTATACASRVEAHTAGAPAPAQAAAPVSVPPEALPGHGRLAMEHLTFMNEHMNRRTSFTAREAQAAGWIAQTLLEMGYPQSDITVQRFDTDIEPIWQEWMDEVGYFGGLEQLDYSQNVILTVPGQSERTIIVGAHYDTFKSYIGASDNASGVALLLESARRMRYLDNYHTLTYVFFGGEEINLTGARYFFDSLTEAERSNILFMFNADVLLEGPYLIYITGVYENGARAENTLTRAWDTLAGQLGARHDMQLINLTDVTGIWFSDHHVFYEEGIPVIFFTGMDRDAEGEFVSSVVHSPLDDLNYINRRRPGMAERNMRAFSLFLEAVLLRR